MLRIGSVVWSVREMAAAVRFWCEALDYVPGRPPSDDWAMLIPRKGAGPQLAIKMVTSAPETRQRHHLDLYASDQTAEVDRLIGLGATRVDWDYEPNADYVVLADIDGNRFCVIDVGGEPGG